MGYHLVFGYSIPKAIFHLISNHPEVQPPEVDPVIVSPNPTPSYSVNADLGPTKRSCSLAYFIEETPNHPSHRVPDLSRGAREMNGECYAPLQK